MLVPDVVAGADGGGRAPAVPRPVSGAVRVARLLAGFVAIAADAGTQTTWLHGVPAVRIDLDGRLHAVVSLVVADGRVTRIVNNPQKPTRLDEPALLSR